MWTDHSLIKVWNWNTVIDIQTADLPCPQFLYHDTFASENHSVTTVCPLKKNTITLFQVHSDNLETLSEG